MLLAALLLAGCGNTLVKSAFSDERMVVTPQDPNSLWNLQMGREYVAAGRYELAREHYLMALAASADTETRAVVAHELESVDLMIKTMR